MPFAKPKVAGDMPFDDDEGWEDMPVVRDETVTDLDEEDKKRYHYVTPSHKEIVNATGNLIDFDNTGHEWREKSAADENDYTRLRLTEEDDNDEVVLRTKYLFDEDKAMTPLSQMQATKDMLTEAQRIAYVGLCALVCREMTIQYKLAKSKELKPAIEALELWKMKIMGRLYYHMELETAEQKMIDSLADHGVQATDLVPSLMTTHTVANPEYDPLEARRQEVDRQEEREARTRKAEQFGEDITENSDGESTVIEDDLSQTVEAPYQTTANVLPPTSATIPGVSTTLSSADKNVTLDIRWTVLCDLFLVLIADSVYDARSRVLLEAVAFKLGLGWLDVVKFEQRVTEALEIQEGVDKLEQQEIIDGRIKAAKRRRYAMMGLATIGGGLVIGLSAGLLAPVIGAGLGAALATVGVSGTTGFLAGAGGAAVITTAGTLTGSGIAIRGMARRTRNVHTFDLLPLHNNKRVNCILTVSGFMTSSKDDVRLPFSVLDPIVGDVFSVLWEPDMLGETGSALKIISTEVLSQVGQTVLQATAMTALMSALQWPILLTKLGYLIDNPWSNALDRARAAGQVLADVLIRRHLGVRPITLIGFSLGARMIFYCLLELAKQKAFGIVQDVFILGATLTAPRTAWLQARSVVSGRFVNGFARNDWVLNYLFRATSGGLSNIAGLRPVLGIPGIENVDVTDKISGHMSYRAFMPLIMDQLGFPVLSDFFDEPEEPEFEGDRVVIHEEEEKKKKSWFSFRSKSNTPPKKGTSRPPGTTPTKAGSQTNEGSDDDELPERIENGQPVISAMPISSPPATSVPTPEQVVKDVPVHVGFNISAMKDLIDREGTGPGELRAPEPNRLPMPQAFPPSSRSESAPLPPLQDREFRSRSTTPTPRRPSHPRRRESEAGPSTPNDLSDLYSRSLSLRDPPANAEEVEEDDVRSSPTEADISSWTSASVLGGYGKPTYGFNDNPGLSTSLPLEYRGRGAAESTLSFGGADGSIWGVNSTPPPSSAFASDYDTNLSSRGFQPVLPSENLLAFKSSSAPQPSSSSNGSFAPDNPFTSSAVSLTFGGQDGSVTSTNAGKSADYWSPPPLAGTRKDSSSTLDLNPWS